jgi:RimJ/RimL family protein N-acetyltransferase
MKRKRIFNLETQGGYGYSPSNKLIFPKAMRSKQYVSKLATQKQAQPSGLRLQSSGLCLREFVPYDHVHLKTMHEDARLSKSLLDPLPFDRPGFASAFIRYIMESYREHEGLGVWAAEQIKAVLSESDLANPEVRALLSDEALEKYSRPHPHFIGWFNLMPVPSDLDEIELGSRLIPSVWGSGVSVKGGEMLLNHAFDALQRDQVWAFCHPQNRSAQYCVYYLGFEYTGTQDYNGQQAHAFRVNRQKWRLWQSESGKKRKCHAVRACRELCG